MNMQRSFLRMTKLIAQKLADTFAGKSCRRVLFVNPPQFPAGEIDISMAKNKRYFANPPYGIGILTNTLLSKGYVVDLFDINHEILSRIHKTEPDGLTIGSIKSAWKHKLKEAIVNFEPDMVGISCMFTTQSDLKEIVGFIKACYNTLPVFVGGSSLIHQTEALLRDCKLIDFVCLYEGDISLCDLLDFVNGKTPEANIKQIATIINDKYIAIEERCTPQGKDINTPPNYLHLPIGEYSALGEVGAYRFWRAPNAKAATVISNRGCRGHCSFCGVRSFCGVGVRSRDITSVVDEIESLKSKYGITHIMWLDDDLLYNEKRAITLFNEITKRKLGVTWDATNGVVAASITHELVQSAVESGCIGLNLGIESGNPEVLRQTNKPASLEHYRRAADILKNYPRIFTRGFLIIGFPNETLRQIQDTINFAKEISLDWYTIAPLCPLPSTKLYSQMQNQRLFKKGNFNPSMREYGSSHMGLKRSIEMKEKIKAHDFFDYFNGNLDVVPDKIIMHDLWFLVDYKINYERILTEESEVKLSKLRKLLTDIADRMTMKNPLANLFLGIIEDKLGNHEKANSRIALSKMFLNNSNYWSKRFYALQLDRIDVSSSYLVTQ